MTRHPGDDTPGRVRHEIPIEPLPTGPLVPRPSTEEPADPPAVNPQPSRETEVVVAPVDEPTAPHAPTAVAVDDPTDVFPDAVARLPERDTAGRGALRPKTPQPANSLTTASTPRTTRPARFSDHRRPIRAAFGLLALVVLASVALAAALGLAVAAVAFAIRQTAG